MNSWDRDRLLMRIRARCAGRTGASSITPSQDSHAASPTQPDHGLGAGGSPLQAATGAVPAAENREGVSPAGGTRSREDVIAEFTAKLESVGGHVYRAESAAEARRLILDVAARHGAHNAVVTDAPELAELGLGAVLADAGVEVIATDGAPDQVRAALPDAALGITGVDYAFAESGTLVMLARPGSPRLASCLPPVHIAVLRPERIRASLAEFVRVFRADQGAEWPRIPSGITFISGPSRTADIEQVVTIGVHGPRELYVILYSPGSSV